MPATGVKQFPADEIEAGLWRDYFLGNPPLLIMVSNYISAGQNHPLSDFNEIVTAGFEPRALNTWGSVQLDDDGAFIDSNEVTNTNEEPFDIAMKGWAILDGIDNTKVLAWWTQNTTSPDMGPGSHVTVSIRWRNRSFTNVPIN